MERTDYTFRIEKDLLEKFKISLELKKEKESEVLATFIRQYIIQSFDSELKDLTAGIKHHMGDAQFGKAISRIPKWSEKPNQINHKILKAFFLLEAKGVVTKNGMQMVCSTEPSLLVRDFNGNFSSMCTDAGKSHGKVFVVKNDGTVTLWEEISDVARKYRHYFVNKA
ncbi:hypothetical protein [Bacillus timonensis]|uniref:hypothetical protein n=1 Tax=Bacillus timonensis TaxID=1033734 RepID=UPI0002897D1D|nr:hypothetical protein [Bacillus timonensis]